MPRAFLLDDLDAGPIIRGGALEAVCSYLEYNPETGRLRFAAQRARGAATARVHTPRQPPRLVTR